MRAQIGSMESEYHRYRRLAEGALRQVADRLLCDPAPGGGNTLAVLVWHVAGNLQSRFTEFLDADGEKPWRNRDEEFAARPVTRDELLAKWNSGWATLFTALADLTDADLSRVVEIRGESLPVHRALHRSLAHVSYHVGQIVHVSRAHCGGAWQYLSIPPGESAAFNASHSADLREARTVRPPYPDG